MIVQSPSLSCPAEEGCPGMLFNCKQCHKKVNLCLTSTYFQYNGKHYKQLHGTAMGSPVSVVVAEIVMQNIEEQALATHTRTVPLYVDDTFNAVHKDGIDDFHEHLNRQNEGIQFTKEIEENDKIPFLDCLVTRDNNNWTKNYYLQKTDTYRPITRPVFVQPDLCYLEALNRGT